MINKTILFLLVLVIPQAIFAAPTIPIIQVNPGASGETTYSVSLQLLMLMTLLSVLPALLITMTSFTRILIVLAILRQALGTAQTPSNQILIGLSLFLSLFVMSPVIEKAYQDAVKPYSEEQITLEEALDKGKEPLRDFMLSQTREADLLLFTEMAGVSGYQSEDEIPLKVLMPSFLTSELKTAFQMGFLIFMPFLIIDLVVASVLMSMGMMMLSPMLISLPFKIMLFVLIDGWTLVVGTLVSSFRI